MRAAITDDAIYELRALIAEARKSPDEWDSLVECITCDDEIKTIKPHDAG